MRGPDVCSYGNTECYFPFFYCNIFKYHIDSFIIQMLSPSMCADSTNTAQNVKIWERHRCPRPQTGENGKQLLFCLLLLVQCPLWLLRQSLKKRNQGQVSLLQFVASPTGSWCPLFHFPVVWEAQDNLKILLLHILQTHINSHSVWMTSVVKAEAVFVSVSIFK